MSVPTWTQTRPAGKSAPAAALRSRHERFPRRVIRSDLTESVIALYGERTGPALALDAARAELEHLVAAAEIRREPPVWARSAALKPLDPVIVDTLAPPLAAQRGRGVRTTCLASTTPAPRRREQYSGGRSRGMASESTRRRAVR